MRSGRGRRIHEMRLLRALEADRLNCRSEIKSSKLRAVRWAGPSKARSARAMVNPWAERHRRSVLLRETGAGAVARGGGPRGDEGSGLKSGSAGGRESPRLLYPELRKVMRPCRTRGTEASPAEGWGRPNVAAISQDPKYPASDESHEPAQKRGSPTRVPGLICVMWGSERPQPLPVKGWIQSSSGRAAGNGLGKDSAPTSPIH